MDSIIHLLPDSLANQIAAGEVVQRPASVVKELLENSIDAGADDIQLIIKEGGKSLIQVVDNGKGMSELDARMCFERHATSKLASSDDLFNIHTYGFRGEAMASIAAVSQVELKTKTAEDEIGQSIKIHGSEIVEQEEDMCATGSSIQVKNLFYNVPARRKFLKSNPVETRHIVEEFQRVALANPQIKMSFFQNDMEVHQLGSGKLSKRIVQLLGKGYQEQLIAVEEETDWVSIKGYIGKPESSKKSRGDQFFFANGRYIKHPYLHHAVTEAYSGLIPDGSHPFYVLDIEIDANNIDVNVHPTKTEVKFEDERSLYAIMKATVKRALGVNNISPSIDFEQDINLGFSTVGKRDYGDDKPPFEIPDSLKNYAPSSPKTNTSSTPSFKNQPLPKASSEDWGQVYGGFEKSNTVNPREEQDTLRFESTINTRPQEEEEKKAAPSVDLVFELHQKYIVSQVKSGVMLIKKQEAYERIWYEKYLSQAENKEGASQQCLFPQTIEMNPAEVEIVEELKEEIQSLGFVFNKFGTNAYIIEGIPADLPPGNEKELFQGFIDQFKLNKEQLQIDTKENLFRSLAKRSAKRNDRSLSKIEITNLIDKLFACKNPNYSPYGDPIYTIMDFAAIDGFFK